VDAIWSLVWRGFLTNDSVHALRAYCEPASEKRAKRVHQQAGFQVGFRSRRTTPPAAQGRWSLNAAAFAEGRSATMWSHAVAQQLLTRYGVVFRETAHAEGLAGGFSAMYDVLKAMEESGRVRRGYFAADLGATQFAMPAAVDLLRSLRAEREGEGREMLMLAATDPANPYGALLRWPEGGDAASSLTRSVGARALVAYLRRGNPSVQVWLPEEEPGRGRVARALADFLVARVREDREETGAGRAGLLISTVNGVVVAESAMARVLLEAGFVAGAKGFNIRRAAVHA
jgi:ATP-dependent Lhr-like helicase